MATNITQELGDRLFRKVTLPASGALSGAPVLCGQKPGVALIDQDANGYATVQFRGSAQLSVKGEDNGGNTAVAAGDKLYYDTAATVKINKDVTNGVFFGYAAEAVSSGATATITVDIGY